MLSHMKPWSKIMRKVSTYHGHLADPSFHIVIEKRGMADVDVLKHRNVGYVAKAPEDIVHFKEVQFSYLSTAKSTRGDRSVNSVHFRPTTDSLEQIAGSEANKESDKEILKRNWREDVRKNGKFKVYPPAFSESSKNFRACGWDT